MAFTLCGCRNCTGHRDGKLVRRRRRRGDRVQSRRRRTLETRDRRRRPGARGPERRRRRSGRRRGDRAPAGCFRRHGLVLSIRWQPMNWDSWSRKNCVVMSLATGDIDGDGREEILVGCADRHVYAFEAEGNLLWRSPCQWGPPVCLENRAPDGGYGAADARRPGGPGHSRAHPGFREGREALADPAAPGHRQLVDSFVVPLPAGGGRWTGTDGTR